MIRIFISLFFLFVVAVIIAIVSVVIHDDSSICYTFQDIVCENDPLRRLQEEYFISISIPGFVFLFLFFAFQEHSFNDGQRDQSAINTASHLTFQKVKLFRTNRVVFVLQSLHALSERESARVCPHSVRVQSVCE